MRIVKGFVLGLLLLVGCNTSQPVRPPNPQDSLYSEQHIDFKKWNRDSQTCCEAKGNKIAIASGGPQSSQAGIAIYKAGGNAVDAAIATALCLNVERPHSTSLAGGGFMLLHLAGTKPKNVFVDFRETAPHKAKPESYLDAQKKPIEGLTQNGAKSVATPGMVAGLYEIHKEWGKLPWATVVQPAVDLANKGFLIYPTLAEKIASRKKLLTADPYTKALLYDSKGEPLKVGDRFVQEDLGHTLELIAKGGKDIFYKGTLAKKIVAAVRERGGFLDDSDLLKYKVHYREPLVGHYKTYTYFTAPPPSAGGALLIEMLNILSHYDLSKEAASPAGYLHLLSEVMKRGYADRSDLIGDPDTLPAEKAAAYKRLLTKEYAASAQKKINPSKAALWSEVKPGEFLPKETHGTTHLSLIDEKGNAISATLTLNIGNFGSGVAVPGMGLFLNNEMDDFTVLPGQPNEYGLVSGEINAIRPNRRPVSSMTPTIFLESGKPVLAVGGAGGSKIISAVMNVVLNDLVLYKWDLRRAIFAPRAHHQWLPETLDLEKAFSAATLAQLTSLGHQVKDPKWNADIEAVQEDPATKTFTAVYDPRNQGGVAAD